jgi:membrane protease YdiL (CAAX protease family)
MSAALFAIVHPPLSMLPVFGLGLCTAFAYERSKGLAAPMLVHAIYNAVVLGYQIYR